MPVPWKRSCAQCRLAKTRCSLSVPNCTRCQARSLRCDYSEALPRAAPSERSHTGFSPDTPRFFHSVDSAAPHIPRIAPIEQMTEPSNVNMFPELQLEDLQWGNSTTDDVDDILRNDPSWFEFPFAGSHLRTGLEEPLDPVFRTPYPEAGQEEPQENNYVTELSRKLFISELAILPWPSPQRIPKRFHTLLSRRPMERLGSELVTNHLFTIINSYPNMLGTPELPPFIHRYCFIEEVDVQHPDSSSELPEPLANCQAFMALFLSKTARSNTFVMKTLFMEVQRLHNEVCLVI